MKHSVRRWLASLDRQGQCHCCLVRRVRGGVARAGGVACKNKAIRAAKNPRLVIAMGQTYVRQSRGKVDKSVH